MAPAEASPADDGEAIAAAPEAEPLSTPAEAVPAAIEISNANFTGAIFGTLPAGEHCWTTAFVANPQDDAGKRDGRWAGKACTPATVSDSPFGNAYMSVATFRRGPANSLRRDNAHFAGQYVVVLDDQADADIDPTYKLETSPGNFQLGFKLDKPITDPGIASRLNNEIARTTKLGADKQGNLMVRYVRMPVACNTKAEPPFKCRLHAFDPNITYTLDQLIEAFELDRAHIFNGGMPPSANPPIGGNTGSTGADYLASDQPHDGQVKDLKSAVDYLCNTDFADDRRNWVNSGLAFRTYSGGYELWLKLSASSAEFKPESDPAEWATFKPINAHWKQIFTMAQDRGWKNPGTLSTEEAAIAASLIAGEKNADIVERSAITVWRDTDRKPVPPELNTLPTPKLNEFCAWFDRSAEETVTAISILAVIHLAMIVVGRGATSTMNNCAALFLALIARSGFGKNYGKNSAKKLLRSAGVSFHIGGSFTSPSAIFSTLRRSPSPIFHLDEFGDRLKNALHDKGGHLRAAYDFLKEVYSATHDAMESPAMATVALSSKQLAEHRKSTAAIHNPVLNLLALTTPDQLWSAVTDAQVEGGFINRIVFVEISDESVISNRSPDFAPPQDLVKHIRNVRTYLGGPAVSIMGNRSGGEALDLTVDPLYSDPDEPATFRQYPFDDTSNELLDQFKDEIKRLYGRDAFMQSISARWRENAMRMAVGLAVFDDPGRKTIPAPITQWCIDYVRFYGQRFAAGLTRHAQPVEFYGKTRKAFLQAFQDRPNGTKSGELGKSKPWRDVAVRLRTEIVADLLGAGLIVKAFDPEESRGARGPRGWRFFAVSD